MSERLTRLTPARLDPAQRTLYKELTGGARASGVPLFPLTDPAGRLLGPFDAMLRNPPVGTALQALGASLRYGGQLTDRSRELVILTVAAHRACVFERDAHERVGRAVGLNLAELAAVRTGDRPALSDAREAAALDTARSLLIDGDLPDPVYATVSAALSEAELVEVIALVGYYGTLALLMRALRADHPLTDDAGSANVR